MGLGTTLRNVDSSLKDAWDRYAHIFKPIGGVVVGGIAVKALEKGQSVLDRLKGRAQLELDRSRGEVPPEASRGIVRTFGGVPMTTIVTIGAVGLLAWFVLRKR